MVELLHIDCMEYMAGLPDKAFDLAIVDPPYGIGVQNVYANDKKVRSGSKAMRSNYNVSWDSVAPSHNYFFELQRVSKNQIIWGANHFLGWTSPCWIVWDKINGDNGFADCELAYTSFNTAIRKFQYRWAGMLQQDMKNKEIRIHPTQKPIQLYKWVLTNYAKPGDKILDTHGGSRSLAIACEHLGFDHVSCEIDLDYHNDSVKRFKDQTAQIKMAI